MRNILGAVKKTRLIAVAALVTGAAVSVWAGTPGEPTVLSDDAIEIRFAASEDGHCIYLGSRKLHLAPGMTAPAALQRMEDPETWRARMRAKLKGA